MKKLFLLVISCLFLFGCSQDVDINIVWPTIYPGMTNAQGQNVIAFGNYNNGQTRAVASSLFGYENFKFYGWTPDSTVINGYEVVYNNGWTYLGVGQQVLHWFDNFVDSYKFIGVIPHDIEQTYNNEQVSVTGVEAFVVDNPYEGVQNEGNDTPKEFLYAYTEVPKANYASGVNMNFVHGNSKVYFKFTSDDANTEILDYYPGTAGYHNYEMQFKPFPAYGPAIASTSITDEDIAYVNGRYSCAIGWIGYYSTSTTVEGDLQTSMWDYLTTQHPTLASENNQNWDSYTSNSNMRLVHIEKDRSNLRGWFVNIQNATLIDKGTAGSTGVEGIVVLPAKVTTTPNRTLDQYVSKANAVIDVNGCTFTPTTYSQKINLTKPAGKISTTPVASPSVLFALPCNDTEVGFVVKFSFVYKGVNVYDARVWIPANHVQWQQGKYYTYTININGRGNGKSQPNDQDANDPIIEETTQHQISVVVNVTNYITGEDHQYSI